VPQVDTDLLAFAAAQVPDFRCRQRRGRHAGLGRGAHRERGRQHRIRAGQHQMLERLVGQIERAPQLLQDVARRLGGGCASFEKGRAQIHQVSHIVVFFIC